MAEPRGASDRGARGGDNGAGGGASVEDEDATLAALADEIQAAAPPDGGCEASAPPDGGGEAPPAAGGDGAAAAGGWEAAYDHGRGAWYFFNRGTGETSWHPPPGWAGGAAGAAAGAAAAGGYCYTDAAGAVQGPFSLPQLHAWRGALPMDLPLFRLSGGEEQPAGGRGGERAEAAPRETVLLADLLGDAALLARWRAAQPAREGEGAAPRARGCTAPPAIAAERELAALGAGGGEAPGADAGGEADADGGGTSYASLAAAALAGLPPDDDAVRLARAAAAAGAPLASLVATSAGGVVDGDYAAAALHSRGRGRVVAAAAGAPGEGLYAEFGRHCDPSRMEEQMARAAAARKRPLTREEVAAAKARRAGRKEQKLRAWLND